MEERNERRAIVPARTLAAFELLQTKAGGHRPHLAGTYIAPAETGTLTAATNGHLMAVKHEPEGYACGLPAIWSANAGKRLRTAKATTYGKNADFWFDLRRNNDTNEQTIATHFASDAKAILDGTSDLISIEIVKDLYVDFSFPDFHWLLRSTESEKVGLESVYVASEVLAKASAFAQKVTDTANPHLSLFLSEPEKTIRVFIEGHPDVVLVMAGLHAHAVSKRTKTLPDWLTAAAKLAA